MENYLKEKSWKNKVSKIVRKLIIGCAIQLLFNQQELEPITIHEAIESYGAPEQHLLNENVHSH